VITQTAKVHAQAWKQVFEERGLPFDAIKDYDEYVDGKPREDGARSFLASRHINLPDHEVEAIAVRKDHLFLDLIHKHGVETYEGTIRYIRAARAAGLKLGLVSSSKHTSEVLRAAKLAGLFEAQVDGNVAARERLAGKPAPDTYVKAAAMLHTKPVDAAVYEDALAGVEAGRAGGFGLVVGVDRAGQANALYAHGADIVVKEPWNVRETRLDLERLGQSESIFALSNGHIGWRANLDEGEPHAIPGSYLNAVYEDVPIPYPETAFGNPEAGQTVVNVTDGKIIRLLVDDEPFDIRYGNLLSHERVLDLKTGLLHRTAEWESPAHKKVHIHSTRLVSLEHRAVAAILYEVQALGSPVDLVLQSELVANEPGAETTTSDPRAGSVVENPLHEEFAESTGQGAVLVHSTRHSQLRIATAMLHMAHCPGGVETSSQIFPDTARFTVTAKVKPGEKLRLVKFVAYSWSSLRSVPALRAQVDGALSSAYDRGWDGLVSDQRRYLSDFWSRSDVELEGDDEVQQAIRFAMFHFLQAAARAEQRAIPAKGLTGPGYDGHTFWDTETFVLPALTYTAPDCVADALRWRHSILDLARKRAHDLGLKGAAFPWRTIHGEECSGYWPASTAAFHINADIADAVLRYVSATRDTRFEQSVGAELLVETARLWASLGHHDRGGEFRIDGVTGPDEYSALADNNLYTNLMAQRNLNAAADAVGRQRAVAKRLKVTAAEVKAWRRAAAKVYIPYEPELKIHKQASQFTDHELWDFAQTRSDQYPLFLHFPYFDLYRKQVVKQADLVLAMHLRGDAFTDEEKARNFAYYEAITVRDSSLSSSTQAVIAAEVGHLRLAHDYLAEAALMDLDDLERNVRDGVHMGSAAGAWIAAVQGLGGMRHHGDSLVFKPRLPAAIRKLTFRVMFLGRLLKVRVDHRRATYSLVRGRALSFEHYGETIRVTPQRTVVRAIPDIKQPPQPKQPAGREPARRIGGSALTSAPPSRRLPSAARPPSRRRPSRRSRARA
jgi:alpha,alpha-trehalose phosphorylase